MAAAFPPEYMAVVMLGNGIAGFGTCCLRAITLIIWPSDKSESNEFKGALALYMFASIILGGCALCQVFLRNNVYFLHYIDKSKYKVEVHSNDEG